MSEGYVPITLPNGATRDRAKGVTGAEVAAEISKSLGKAAFACKINGRLSDLSQPIELIPTDMWRTREFILKVFDDPQIQCQRPVAYICGESRLSLAEGQPCSGAPDT